MGRDGRRHVRDDAKKAMAIATSEVDQQCLLDPGSTRCAKTELVEVEEEDEVLLARQIYLATSLVRLKRRERVMSWRSLVVFQLSRLTVATVHPRLEPLVLDEECWWPSSRRMARTRSHVGFLQDGLGQ